MMRGATILWALVALAACQLPGADRKTGPSPLAAEVIEVTSLEKGPSRAEEATPQPDAAPDTAAPPPAEPAAPEAAASAPEAAPAALPLSPEAQACQRRGGTFLRIGGSAGLGVCQTPTRDALKACRRGTDCEGECLARSGTCAPAQPLFGCNDILDNLGRRATQCRQ